MHFGRFKHDSRRGSVRQFGRFAEKRIEEVHSIVVTQPVDAEVTIDAVMVESILVGIDATT